MVTPYIAYSMATMALQQRCMPLDRGSVLKRLSRQRRRKERIPQVEAEGEVLAEPVKSAGKITEGEREETEDYDEEFSQDEGWPEFSQAEGTGTDWRYTWASDGERGAQGPARRVRRQDTGIGRTPVYDVVQVDAEGRAERRKVTRRSLLREMGVDGRDLRRVDPSLHVTTSSPAIVPVAGRAVLVNLAGVRLVAKEGACILFDPDSEAAGGFLDALLARVAAAKGARLMEGLQSAAAGEETSSTELETEARAPFELEAVEAALLEATAQQDARLLDLSRKAERIHSRLAKGSSPSLLDDLRATKRALVELDSRSGALRQTLVELVDDREELRELRVSQAPAHDAGELEEREEEAENLLEYYLQRCDACHCEAERLLQDLRDLEESVSVTLSARRYEVSKLELLLSISTLALSLGGLITGLFGMNLRSCMENSVIAFYGFTAFIFVKCFAVFQFLFRYTRRLGVL